MPVHRRHKLFSFTPPNNANALWLLLTNKQARVHRNSVAATEKSGNDQGELLMWMPRFWVLGHGFLPHSMDGTILSKNWKRFHFGWFSSDYRGNDNFLNWCALLCDLIALHRLILVAIHASLIIRKLTSLMEKFAWEDKDVWWIATFSLAVLEDAKLAWHVLSIFAIT